MILSDNYCGVFHGSIWERSNKSNLTKQTTFPCYCSSCFWVGHFVQTFSTPQNKMFPNETFRRNWGEILTDGGLRRERENRVESYNISKSALLHKVMLQTLNSRVSDIITYWFYSWPKLAFSVTRVFVSFCWSLWQFLVQSIKVLVLVSWTTLVHVIQWKLSRSLFSDIYT